MYHLQVVIIPERNLLSNRSIKILLRVAEKEDPIQKQFICFKNLFSKYKELRGKHNSTSFLNTLKLNNKSKSDEKKKKNSLKQFKTKPIGTFNDTILKLTNVLQYNFIMCVLSLSKIFIIPKM